MTVTLEALRRLAVAQTLFPPVSLREAFDRLGYVQADPIRAPARAQDLTLRQRVRGYRAGDLERRYAALGIEEDFFVNYGFVSRAVHALMHPRSGRARPAARPTRADDVLAFVRSRGEVHPREVDCHFAQGTVVNYWGGSSRATTRVLEHLHYRGLLRVTGRDKGTRLYALREPVSSPPDSAGSRQRLDALIDVLIRNYAPLPGRTLSFLVARLRYAVPQWRRALAPALRRARERLAHARIGGVDWYWPADVDPAAAAVDDRVRLLAPFDPVVWDRYRFEQLWGWRYRFEAYTPVAKRKLGYYALPLLWQDCVIGWATLCVADGSLTADAGYSNGRPPRSRAFRRAFEAEVEAIGAFLRPAVTGRVG